MDKRRSWSSKLSLFLFTLAVAAVCVLILTQSIIPVPWTSRHIEFRVDTRPEVFAKVVAQDWIAPTIEYNPAIRIAVVEYTSRVDGTAPLYANVVFDPSKGRMPVMLYMHGYSGNRSRALFQQARIAEQGFFVIAPDMRGRGVKTDNWPYSEYAPEKPYPDQRFEADLTNFLRQFPLPPEYRTNYNDREIRDLIRSEAWDWFDSQREVSNQIPSRFTDLADESAGRADDGAIEVHDIVDAFWATNEQYSDYMNADDVNIIGFSGGGSVFSAITKFPDFFKNAASFFGISDFEYWFFNANTSHRPFFRRAMIQNIGGTPDQVPDRYKARASLDGVINNPYTAINLYWDEHEVQCPGYFITEYGRRARALGYDNVILHETTAATDGRARHIWPFEPSLNKLVDRYLETVSAARNMAAPVLSATGQMRILGYVRTNPFFIKWTDGGDTVVDLDYDLGSANDGLYRLSFAKKSGPADATGRIELFELGARTIRVTENDRDLEGWTNHNGTLVIDSASPNAKYQVYVK